MNLQKKESLARFLNKISQNDFEFDNCSKRIQEIYRQKAQWIIDFLAELEAEKPEEDNALAIAKIIALNDRELEDDAKLIQQFSDNRIAEKCAECVGKLPAFPSRPEER